MKIIVVNAILYTSESIEVKRIKSIKDCMIYDLCLAFSEKGHDVTLLAADEYKPTDKEEYPFKIEWFRSYFPKVFIPNKIPCNVGMKKYIKEHDADMIICSEVFSMDTLFAVQTAPRKVVVWQEMAFHQKMAKQMASKFWHNVIVKRLYKNVRIIPRTENAQKFIRQYSNKVSDEIIPHGINTNKFKAVEDKEPYFVVSSQIIPRKRIHLIIKAFADFCEKAYRDYKLFIMGDGESKTDLENLAENLGIKDHVIFTGRLDHDRLISYLDKAKAMLVYTEKDNSMISIAESLALGTPVITTSVPDNAESIRKNNLGIVSDTWGWKEMKEVADRNKYYVKNCINYCSELDNYHLVDKFIEIEKGI